MRGGGGERNNQITLAETLTTIYGNNMIPEGIRYPLRYQLGTSDKSKIFLTKYKYCRLIFYSICIELYLRNQQLPKKNKK